MRDLRRHDAAHTTVNWIQKALSAFMGLVILGMILVPEWHLRWTVRYEGKYWYDSDLPARGGAAVRIPYRTVEEYESFTQVRRGPLFLRPRPLCQIPPRRVEPAGTGFASLGSRHIIYTNAEITALDVRVNVAKLIWEVTVLLIPWALFLTMFRNRPPPPRVQYFAPEDRRTVARKPVIFRPQGRTDGGPQPSS